MPSPLLCCNVMFGEISSIKRGSRCRYEVLVLVLLYNVHMSVNLGEDALLVSRMRVRVFFWMFPASNELGIHHARVRVRVIHVLLNF